MPGLQSRIVKERVAQVIPGQTLSTVLELFLRICFMLDVNEATRRARVASTDVRNPQDLGVSRMDWDPVMHRFLPEVPFQHVILS